MSNSDANTHHHAVVPVPEDIDHMGHVNNAVYLRWVQDAVIAHWRAIATPEALARYLWIALRHEINYRRPAFLGDVLDVITTLTDVRGARAYYDTIVKRGAEVLATVHSCWCSLDATTLKPVRLGSEIRRA